MTLKEIWIPRLARHAPSTARAFTRQPPSVMTAPVQIWVKPARCQLPRRRRP